MHGDDVVLLLGGLLELAVADRVDLVPRRQQALGEQEAGRELPVVAGRAHRHRDARRLLAGPADADLERLLGREPVAAPSWRGPRSTTVMGARGDLAADRRRSAAAIAIRG